MMASTSPSENHEAPPSSVWSTKGSTAIEGRRRWKLSTIGAGADSGSEPGPERRRRRRAPARPDGIGVHRPAHVAQLERPQLLDRLLEAAGDQVHHRRRHQHAADRRMLLQARHDVDAVAQEVGALDGDLAHVDGAAQLEPHRRVLSEGGPGHRRLHGKCGARGVDRAGELDQQPVAQRLEDAPAARCDQRIDRLAQRPPRAQHALLVGLDEGAEVDDVERHDHDQPAAAVRGVAGARFRTLASHVADSPFDDGAPTPEATSPFAPDSCAPEAWRHRDGQAFRAPTRRMLREVAERAHRRRRLAAEGVGDSCSWRFTA